jgi:hypothetical protein
MFTAQQRGGWTTGISRKGVKAAGTVYATFAAGGRWMTVAMVCGFGATLVIYRQRRLFPAQAL